MMRGLKMLCALACVFALACEEEPPPPAPIVPPPRVPLAAPRVITTPASFDFVLAGEEPTLVWGAPNGDGGGLHAIRLNAVGELRGAQQTLVAGASAIDLPPDAIEVVAASSAGRLAVAWIERHQLSVRTRAVVGDANGERFAEVVELGPSDVQRVGLRGQVAVVVDDRGRVEVLHRKPPGPCTTGGREECAQFAIRRLGSPSARRGLPLAVPEPCANPIVGFAFAGRSFYYGLCSEQTGRPITTTYAIRFEPEYAQAVPTLEGCTPLGIAESGSSVTVVGQCQDARRGMSLEQAGEVRADVRIVPVKCEDGRPVLPGESAPLQARRDRLGPLLGANIGPVGSRALWTGQALLVAAPIGREVSLRRYQCEDDHFLRTDTR